MGGPSSSFGIWHELIDEVKAIVAKHNLQVFRIHTHIGSGSDPAVWQRVSGLSLDLVRQFPGVTVLNLGGGYKVGRMSYEVSTDLEKIGAPVKDQFVAFAEETGRQLQLEIEPGTFLVANAGALISKVQVRSRGRQRASQGRRHPYIHTGPSLSMSADLPGGWLVGGCGVCRTRFARASTRS